jgi:hypothetical protein
MKNVIKAIVFFMIFLVLLGVSSYVFVPKNNTTKFGIRQKEANGILGEENNTIDALFVGDSLVYTAISPMVIWEKYGISSYDLSTSAQFLYESYSFLDKALKTQKPKIVFLEVNTFFRKYKLTNVIGAEGKKIFPVFEYHNRWKKLSINDFFSNVNYTWTDYNKGYRFMDKISAPDDVNKDYMRETKEIKEIPKLNYRYIKMLIELCQSKNIEVVLLSTPSMKNYNYKKYKAAKELAKEFNLDYLDLNLDFKIGIDWSIDSMDGGDHLNWQGALKVSNYLGLFMKERGLANHKNNPKYASWNTDLKNYKNKNFNKK